MIYLEKTMYKSLHELPNPYKPFDEIKNEKLFVSRRKEINKVEQAIDNYLSSGVRRNFVVIGDKSLGKSSFLHQLKTKFILKDFLTVYFTLTPKKAETELVFFKELFDSIISAGEENDFLHRTENNIAFTQYEIWESLTTYGQHKSNKMERRLFLGDIYANSLIHHKFDISLSETKLTKDFRYLSKDAQQSCYQGISILIDEIQFLSHNDSIIQLLLQVMQNTEDIIFVLCGDNRIKTESFEKILRHTEQIEILPFYHKNEVVDLIYKPLRFYGFTQNEINDYLDFKSIRKILDREVYNPYHINLILYYMFEKFKKENTEKLAIDANVTSEVINSLKNIAPHHERITDQLHACSIEQLEALRRLFPYQKLNLYDISLLVLNLKPIQDEKVQKIFQDIINDMCLVEPLHLFKIYCPSDTSIQNFKEQNISNNVAADIKYEFIGDSIDALYASYIIESTLQKEFKSLNNSDFIKLIAERLWIYLLRKAAQLLNGNKDDNKYIPSFANISLPEHPSDLNINSSIVEDKIKQLEEIVEDYEKTDSIAKNIDDIKKVVDFSFLSHFSNQIGHDSGFYYVFVKAKIRYKIVLLRFFIPYTKCFFDTFSYYINEFYDSDVLAEYKIQILDSVIFNIKPNMILFLNTIDINDLQVMIYKNVYFEHYEEALDQLNLLRNITTNDGDINNDIGFVHILNGEIIQAKKYIEIVKDKNYATYCNIGYLYYLEENYNKSYSAYKAALKFLNKIDDLEANFFVIHQILLPLDSRQPLPKIWDLAYEPSANIIVRGNLALLSSFDNQTHGFKLINEATINTPQDNFYVNRYKSWLNYNLGHYDKALDLIKNLLENIPDIPMKKHLEKLAELDLKIQKKDM